MPIPFFFVRIAMAQMLTLVLLILCTGNAHAMDGNFRAHEDVVLPNDKKLLLTPESSALKMEGEVFSSGSSLVRRLIGSSTPECGHTCGACSPCTVEMVSFECSYELRVHAEACPVGYLCVCHGKAFPIP